jgi:hypothetical protein
MMATVPVWFFAPGTERRVLVEVVTHRASAAGDEAVELPPERRLWIIPCYACGTNFTLRHEHGITVGPDGALTTDHSFNCPKCGKWHARFNGGVAVPA